MFKNIQIKNITCMFLTLHILSQQAVYCSRMQQIEDLCFWIQGYLAMAAISQPFRETNYFFESLK